MRARLSCPSSPLRNSGLLADLECSPCSRPKLNTGTRRAFGLAALAIALSCESVRSSPPEEWWDSSWKQRASVDLDRVEASGRDLLVEIPLEGQPIDSVQGTADLRFVLHGNDGEPLVLDHWIWTDRITNGAWFACCQNGRYQQYHTPAATYYTCLRPNAIHHVGSKDRTYFVYGDFTRDPVVRFLDHETNRLSPTMIPGATQISSDAHGNPSLLVDDRGHVVVFYGCHGHPIQVRRSLEPESIDRWSREGRIDVLASYPQPYMIAPGKIVVSFRRTGTGQHHPWAYVTSTDYGSTWSRSHDLVGRSGYAIYGISEVARPRAGESEESSRSFHLAFTPFQYQSALYKGVYYMRSDDGLRTFVDAGGEILGTAPLDVTRADVVFPPGNRSSHVNDLVLGAEGQPYILFNVGDWNESGAPGPGEWRVAHVGDDGGWTSAPVAACDHLFDRGCLRVDDSGALYAYLPIGSDGADGGVLTEVASFDEGETWSVTRVLGDAELASRSIAMDEGAAEPGRTWDNYAVRVVDADPDFQVLWSSGPSEPTGRHSGSVPSEVVLFGEDGVRSRIVSGNARALVRIPKVMGPDDRIYLYSDNPHAHDGARLDRTFRSGYTVDTHGHEDATLLGEWRMEPAAIDDGSLEALAQSIAIDPRLDISRGFTVVPSSEDQVDDASGLANAVTLTGGAELVRGGPPLGRRLDLTRGGHVLHLATGAEGATNAALAGPERLDAFSLELWASLESAVGRMPALHIDADRRVLELRVGSPLEVWIDGGDGPTQHAFETPTLGIHVWHHFVVTFDGESVRAIIDGLEAHTLAAGSGAVSNEATQERSNRSSEERSVGASQERSNARELPGSPFTGSIPWRGAELTLGDWGTANAPVLLDDVRVYARALSQTEILAHFEGRDEAGLVAYLRNAEFVPEPDSPTVMIAPNPARADVHISFSQAAEQPVRVGIFDASGRRVRNLVDAVLPAGTTRIVWDRRTDEGRDVPTSIYFVGIVAGETKSTGRVMVLR